MDLVRNIDRQDRKRQEDYGFFGPDSPTWRVWTCPTALTIGFQRSVVVEELDPFLLAAVNSRRGIYTNPKLRYDRTIRYFATVAVGDARSALDASEILVKVHAKAVGIEPVSGKRFDANDPDSQLWILLTGWHSVLIAYERFGPGKLSAADEARYWEECAIAAELQTCPSSAVPRTRQGIRQYFAEMRPRLAASELTQSTMRYLLDGSRITIDANTSRAARPFLKLAAWVMRAATLSTMPAYMRELAGIRQPHWIGAAIAPLVRAAMKLLATQRASLALVDAITPSTRPVIEPVIRGVAPERGETLTPAEARERYGRISAADMYRRILQGGAGEGAAEPAAAR
ncbi:MULTISPECIES: oxygenase MpaB family protein [Burkholderia]|uniref:oxygenase MpaB family protein n=1 Tax=Burkholderia TaxID=32008 RepID=UPI000A82084E|nr:MULTISPECIES: oxygenase MpaB family protein [Burkholderia]